MKQDWRKNKLLPLFLSQKKKARPALALDFRPKVWINSDVFGDDKDDGQSMMRLLLNSNKINLQGISVSYPAAHTNATKLINLLNNLCATDMNALRVIDPLYPTAAQVAAKVYQGKATTGAPTGGASTAGSNALIAAALAASPSAPLWVLNWGPYGDLAQALFDNPAIAANIRVYGIAPRAGYNYTADTLAADYILSRLVPGQSLQNLWFIANDTTFRGIYCGAAGENTPNRDWAPVYAWGHGELGDLYGDFCWDMQGDGTNAGAKEGDTPSLLYILDNVLVRGTGDDPTSTGWGGRFQRDLTLGNNYWKDVTSGQTLGSYAGANTIRIYQTDIFNQLRDQFDLLANPTVYEAETLSNITGAVTGIAGRTSVPTGETWENYRADRAANIVNNNNQDYITGSTTSTSLHVLNEVMPSAEYTVEGLLSFTATSSSVGLLMNLSGTQSGGNGQFYQVFLFGTTPFDWTIGKDVASAGATLTGNTATQASTIAVGTNTYFRLKMRRVGNQIQTWARKLDNTGWVSLVNWTDTGTPLTGGGKAGVRGTSSSRAYVMAARSN